MFKLGKNGFTLIELLAVITIMGILMMVAIPSVTRTIENSRRDTFANLAKEYINAVRNAVLADNIECTVGSDTMVASATPDGTYYFTINTADTQTKDLMESGGKSPFGGAEISGYVKWVKSTTGSADAPKTQTVYSIWVSDSGKHGMKAEAQEFEVKRGKIETALTAAQVAPAAPTDAGANSCTNS